MKDKLKSKKVVIAIIIIVSISVIYAIQSIEYQTNGEEEDPPEPIEVGETGEIVEVDVEEYNIAIENNEFETTEKTVEEGSIINITNNDDNNYNINYRYKEYDSSSQRTLPSGYSIPIINQARSPGYEIYSNELNTTLKVIVE